MFLNTRRQVNASTAIWPVGKRNVSHQGVERADQSRARGSRKRDAWVGNMGLTMRVDNVQRTSHGSHYHPNSHKHEEHIRGQPSISTDVVGDESEPVEPDAA